MFLTMHMFMMGSRGSTTVNYKTQKTCISTFQWNNC